MTVNVTYRSPGKVSVTKPSNNVVSTESVQEVITVKGGAKGETGPQGPQGIPGVTPVTSITYSLPGVLYSGAGSTRLYFYGPCIINRVIAAVGTSPSGASVIIDVNKNGTSVYGIQTNRPTIASGLYVATSVPSVTSISTGEYLTVDVDQVGSVVSGADLVVTIEYTRTE